jgi:predicted ATPase
VAKDRRKFGRGPYLKGARLNDDQDGWPFDLAAVRALAQLDLTAPVTFLVGENGTGKSTLIEGLAVAFGFSAQGGPLSYDLEEELSERDRDDPLARDLVLDLGERKPRNGFFLRAESFFNIAQVIDRKELDAVYGGQPLGAQSHGESFVALAANRFGPEGIYLLDEPEAALSLTSCLAFLNVMSRAIAGGAQFVIATHSPVLLALPRARIYEIDDTGVAEVDYDDAGPVSLTRAFLDAPERFLRALDPE